LRLLDPVGLVGGEKIAVRRTLSESRRRQQQTPQQGHHFRLPSINPSSSSSWTCWTRAFTLSSSGRSAKSMSRWKVSSFLDKSRVAISAGLNQRGLLRGFLPVF